MMCPFYAVLGLVVIIEVAHSASTVGEFCEDEAFVAECAQDEAIFLETALYGRMRIGKCVKENYRLGCSVDVRGQIDRWCSGRPKCEVLVTSLMHDGNQPCPKDFRSYLQVGYTCIPVVQASPEDCYGNRPVKISATEGYISSLVTRQSGCGSADHPWLIEADPGQVINMTLYDFSMYNSDTKGSDIIDSDICMVYATIKEPTGTRSETICGGKSRVSHVFTSRSSTVEVRLMASSPKLNEDSSQFILQYQTVGCSDPDAPEGGWMRREGDRTTIGCQGTNKEWTLICEGSRWRGKMGTCPHDSSSDRSKANSMFASSNIPRGMSIVIVVGIALVVGLCILLVGLLCLRRQRLRVSRHRYATATKPTPNNNDGYDSAKMTCPPEYFGQNGENDYYKTWQLQQRARGGPVPLPLSVQYPDQPGVPPPHQTYRALSTDSAYSAQNSRYSEHVYESPKFDRHDMIQQEDGGHVKYFELDPETPGHAGRSSRDGVTSGVNFVPKTDASVIPKR